MLTQNYVKTQELEILKNVVKIFKFSIPSIVTCIRHHSNIRGNTVAFAQMSVNYLTAL